MAVDLRLLGPIRVSVDGRDLPINHPRQRQLLALLLIDADRTVPSDRLISLIWDDALPSRPRNVLAGHVARLRRSLSDIVTPVGGSAEPGRCRLVGEAGGYRLAVDPACVDLHRFRDLLARARRADDDEHRVRLLESALREWDGPALGGLTGRGVDGVRAGLLDEWRRALIEYCDGQLLLGRHDDVLRELDRSADEHRYDEDLNLRMMIALRDSGDAAGAARVYATIRHRLRFDLDTAPGPELAEVATQLRRVGTPARPSPRTAEPAHHPARHPTTPEHFFGRADELGALDTMVADVLAHAPGRVRRARNLVSIAGMPGAGKTTLATHWSRQVRDHFTDGQVFVPLRGHDSGGAEPLAPAEILATVLLALGVPVVDIPYGVQGRAAVYRTVIAHRDVLLVLDDAAGLDQVVDLLPPADSGSVVVVTSRELIRELPGRYGALSVVLGALDPEAALALLVSVAGEARVTGDLDGAHEFLRVCGSLPLTVRLGAAHAQSRPDASWASVAADLGGSAAGGSPRPSGTGHRASSDTRTVMRRALALSYRRLDAHEQSVFGWLGVFPGAEFGRDAVAALAGMSLDTATACLARLIGANLLLERDDDRFRLHDLVRSFAQEIMHTDDAAAERRRGLLRLLNWYTERVERGVGERGMQRADQHRITAGPSGSSPVHSPHFDWLDQERANICALIEAAAAEGMVEPAAHLVDTAVAYVRLRPAGQDWSTAVRHLTEAAGRLDVDIRIHTGLLLIRAEAEYREAEHAAEVADLHISRAAARRADWTIGEGLSNAGLGRAHWSVGNLGLAERYLDRAAELHARVHDAAGQANAIGRLARLDHDRGRLARSLARFERVLDLAQLAHSSFGLARATAYTALVLFDLGRSDEAAATASRAHALSQDIGFAEGIAVALSCQALVECETGSAAVALSTAFEVHAGIPPLHEPRIAVDCLARAGRVESAAGRPDLAEHTLLRTEQLASDIGYRQGVAHARCELAAVYLQSGRPQQADAALQATAAVLATTDVRLVRARVERVRADRLFAAGRFPEAIGYYRRSATMSRECGHALGEVRALLGWGRAADAASGHGSPDPPWRRALLVATAAGLPDVATLRVLLHLPPA